MISFISSWASGVITAVIIAGVIEMIIPEGSSKKYIKVIIGIFILFSIISPVLNRFKPSMLKDLSIDFEKYQDTKEVSIVAMENEKGFNIKQIYEKNLEVDIKSKIKKKGFETEYVKLNISSDGEYSIEKLEIKISGKVDKEVSTNKNNVIGIVDTVERVSIDLTNKIQNTTKEFQISPKDEQTLRDYLANTYSIDENYISIS